jgi:hypothetical protein
VRLVLAIIDEWCSSVTAPQPPYLLLSVDIVNAEVLVSMSEKGAKPRLMPLVY